MLRCTALRCAAICQLMWQWKEVSTQLQLVSLTRCACCTCLQMGGDRPERAGLTLFLDKEQRE